MAIVKGIRSYIRQAVGPTLAVSIFAYFAYHAIEGDRGLLAWMQLTQDVAVTQAELDKVTHVREELDHQASLMRSDAIDPDMLDEKARAVLGVVRKDDVIIVQPKGSENQSEAEPRRQLALAVDANNQNNR
jgi:cell division protein FtsB